MAEGLPATVYIFSDGKFPDVEGFSLGNLKPEFYPIGEPRAANLGITAFSTRRREDRHEQLQAFARIENFGPEPITAEVELWRGGSLADADKLELKAGGSGGVAFREIFVNLKRYAGGGLGFGRNLMRGSPAPETHHVVTFGHPGVAERIARVFVQSLLEELQALLHSRFSSFVPV